MTTQRLYQRYYDVSKLVIWADNPSEEGKRARLVLSFRDGNPRFVVYTGGTGKDAVIQFPMDIPNMTTAMLMLEDIANGANDQQLKIGSLGMVYENNKVTKEKRVVATLLMGKSKDGIVYLCVVSEGKPKIVFPIKTSIFHTWTAANGEVVPDSVISKKMTLGIVKTILMAIGNIMVSYSDEEYSTGARKSASTNQNETTSKPTGKQPEFLDLDDIL